MTLRSMTGFGRGRAECAVGGGPATAVVVEVRSVNLKGLEVKLRLPRALHAEEPAFVRAVKAHLERGRVDVSVDVVSERSAGTGVVDEARVAAIVAAVAAIAARHPTVSADITAGQLLAVPGVLLRADDDAVVDDSALAAAAASALADAVTALVAAREDEGRGLADELRRRKAAITALVDDIAARTQTTVADKQHKLSERLTTLLGEHLEPTRLMAEAAVLAERLDVTEELARLRLHLDALEQQLASTSGTGRRLDFLCQEFLREANTTASKCSDAATAHLVVELKAEIERLREQAQNVE